MANQGTITSPALTIDSLADNVLVDIFSFLDVKDKCRTAQVCRRWNSLIHQKSLWKHIDLTPFKVDLRSIWKLVRAYYTDMLLSLRLHGFTESIKSTECISNAVLTDIKSRCPNLRELFVTKANLITINSSLLPAALKQLTLHKCLISVDWLKPAVDKGLLKTVEKLSLCGTTRTSDATLKDLTKLPKLKSINLSGCYRIGESGVSAICQSLSQIEEAYFDGCDINDQCLHHIGTRWTSLKVIILENCSRITDVGLGSLSILKKLTHVNLVSCSIGKQGVINFLTVTPSVKLECLKLSKDADYTGDDVSKLESLKPGLQVELI
ncbi:F-box/LRR-repeat protein 12-like [Amphiura filiformis]|uniref:F-box/LRR-repeat protein 12-like n=1 Tax=Amphiura filiformis TaxID=82378 RepID=UPI003B20DB4D